MPQSHTIDALYAVGRNVLKFQRLEQILKGLALRAPICASLSTFQSVVENRKAQTQRLTLGWAVKKWIESTNQPPKQHPGLQSENEIIVTCGFEISPPEYFDHLSVELESLAQERNNLIHLELAQLNFEDEAECTALTARLNAQNDRIERAIEVVGRLLSQMQDLAQAMASDDIQREIRNLRFQNLSQGS
ncbi:MAG TPA: hypothetical protein VJU84_01505 [Pyrinomonadaceae bacterium]|nr:hypothetical protein [Pyrinomonadaceae bacterium]